MLAAAQAAPLALAPPDAQDLPPSAADHVVVMEVEQAACTTCGRHRRTLTRSGRWLRDERIYADRAETRYSDFVSGTTFRLVRDLRGAVLSLSVERLSDGGDYRLQRRAPTGRHDRALGEPCEIWTATSRFLNAQSCETADGIQLWSRHPSTSGGADLSSARAVSIERRPVRPEEVRPPSDLFRLAPWPKGSAGGGGGYEVRLVSTTRGEPRVQVRRHQGDRWSGHRDSGDGTHRFSAADGSSRFSYTHGADSRPLALEVALWSASRFSHGLGEKWVRLPGRRARTVLGERCTWQEDVGIRSTDAHYECRTADGIPLMLEDDWHWDSVTDIYTAESLVRRPLAEADMAPPPASVDWAAWGVEL